MPTGKITKRSVDAVQAGQSDQFLWDEDLAGFGLRVTTKGAKSYVLQYRMGGREAKTRRYTIGKHGSPWTPDTARKEGERLLIMVRQGVDPAEASKTRRRQAVDLAFSSYADQFVDLYLKDRWKDWKLGEAVIKNHVKPVLRDKPLPEINRAALNPIWDSLRDRPAVARLTFATMRKFFRWSVGRGDIERSPLEGIEAPQAAPARDRVLSDQELRLVWVCAAKAGHLFDSAIRLLVVTGQRRDEVAGLQWSELDRDGALWALQGTRTKNGKPHLVPLNTLAVEVLDTVAGGKTWPRRGLVFSTTGKTPVSGFSKAKTRLDTEMAKAGGEEIEPWRLHDLRRTVATGLQRLGVRFEVTEAVLNHVSGAKGGIAGVYQRHDWKDEKRTALEAWGRHVAATLATSETSNVVPLAGAA